MAGESQCSAKVRDRLLRATSALNQAGVPYAVVGGNAVASWVATVDEGAVRNTRDVDILVRRADLPAVTAALENAGLVGRSLPDVATFRKRDRNEIGLLFAGEYVRPDNVAVAPRIETTSTADNFRVITLPSLVKMKLVANRNIDRTHLRDLIDVYLIDASWQPKLPPELAARLKQILDTPDSQGSSDQVQYPTISGNLT